MNKSILEMSNIQKSFNNQEVLKDISMSVDKGKIYGLLGVNGAGKSTLLKIISGINKPEHGNILFGGEEIKENHYREIGVLIEHPSVYPNLTAYENLKAHAILLKLPEKRIIEVLEIIGLKNEKKVVKKFSMGMKQRLGIGLAIMNNPKLLILDEPTNGLDPFGIMELRQTLRNFKEEGMSIIISSHILSEIENVADTVGILNDGRIVYENEINKVGNLESVFSEILFEKWRDLND